jgi:hypothetical protein
MSASHSIATELMRRNELPLCAIRRHSHCSRFSYSITSSITSANEMCTDVSSIAKLAEAVSTAKKRWRMALIPEFVDQGWSVTRAIGYNPTIRLDLVPVGVMPLTGCLLGAVPPSLITSLSRHARAVS